MPPRYTSDNLPQWRLWDVKWSDSLGDVERSVIETRSERKGNSKMALTDPYTGPYTMGNTSPQGPMSGTALNQVTMSQAATNYYTAAQVNQLLQEQARYIRQMQQAAQVGFDFGGQPIQRRAAPAPAETKPFTEKPELPF